MTICTRWGDEKHSRYTFKFLCRIHFASSIKKKGRNFNQKNEYLTQYIQNSLKACATGLRVCWLRWEEGTFSDITFVRGICQTHCGRRTALYFVPFSSVASISLSRLKLRTMMMLLLLMEINTSWTEGTPGHHGEAQDAAEEWQDIIIFSVFLLNCNRKTEWEFFHYYFGCQHHGRKDGRTDRPTHGVVITFHNTVCYVVCTT